MTTYKLSGCRAFFIFVMLCLAGCGGDSGSGSTVTIGVLNSETGALASTGVSMKKALEIAEQEVNQRLSGENAGFNIRLEFADTQTDPVQALERLKEFSARGIKIVVGPLSTSEAVALSEFSVQNGIVLISPSSTAVSLERSDDLILRMPQSDRGHALAITSALRYFGTRFYVPVWRADSFGDDLVQTVGEDFEAKGGRFAPGSRYDTTTTEFSSALQQLEIQLDAYVDFFGNRSAAVYAVAFDEVWSLLAQASTRSHILRSVLWYGSDGIALNYGLFQSPEAVQFMIDTKMLSPIYAGDPSNQEFIDVRAEIESTVQEKVKPYAVLGYDAVILIAKALQSLGTTEVSGGALRDEIIRVSSQTQGASGNLALNGNGDRISGIFEFWRVLKDASGAPYWVRGGTFQSDANAPDSGVFIPE